MGRVLEVDLSSGDHKSYPLPERLLELYAGNKGLGARLLYDLLPPGVDPLSPENILIITTAPLTGTGAPGGNRFNVTTKSPLTGAIASSNCGGNFGIYLKAAGYDALIIKGKAPRPAMLNLGEQQAALEDAGELWGLDTGQTRNRLPADCGHLVIGPAGENLVKFAGIFSGERAAGRAGTGAVMGSKQLKAVLARGSLKPRIARPDAFQDACDRWRKLLLSHPATGRELPAFGTGALINKCNATLTLPTRNFKYGRFDKADEVSGETLAQKHLVKSTGCNGCPVACGRVVSHNGQPVRGPEFQTLGLLGPNLLIYDLGAIIEWNHLADLYGLDTISLGVILGFVMEAGEKGLFKTGLKFGCPDHVSKTIEDIAYRRGFGGEMAEGVRYLAGKYGGKEFAMHVKGLEMASYEPRGAVGQGLSYAVSGGGGCHPGGGYAIYLEAAGPVTVNPLTSRGKPGLAALIQTILEGVSSLGCCPFMVYLLFPKELLRLTSRSKLVAGLLSFGLLNTGSLVGVALSLPAGVFRLLPAAGSFPQLKAQACCTGSDFSLGHLLKLGSRAVNMERLFNLREGFTWQDDTLPERLVGERQRFEEPRTRVDLAGMLPKYYRLRGWDREGVPLEKTLRRLCIHRGPLPPGSGEVACLPAGQQQAGFTGPANPTGPAGLTGIHAGPATMDGGGDSEHVHKQ